MNCHDLRDSFSARFDGELDAEACAAFEEHCTSCVSCATAWWDFLRSTRALREVGVGAVSDDYVDSIVAGVLHDAGAKPLAVVSSDHASGGTPPTRTHRLRLVTHAAAALVGAALVLLYTSLAAPATSTEIDSALSVALIDETDHEAATTSIPEVEESGFAEREPPPPTIRVVEHYIDRIEYVPLPIPTETKNSGEALAKAMTRFGGALSDLSESLAAHSRILASNAESRQVEESPIERAPVSPPEPRRVEPQAPLRAIARLEAPAANVSIVSRDGTLSLETHGTLDEVVPALIARLGDPDPRVGELVEQRLRQVWSEQTGLDSDQSTIGVVESENMGRFGWRRWFPGESPAEEHVDSREAWSSWWADERGLVATAGI